MISMSIFKNLKSSYGNENMLQEAWSVKATLICSIRKDGSVFLSSSMDVKSSLTNADLAKNFA
ncbi:hypothetical protein CAI16_14460 [Virgibacillus dokdonensis]|uniref:Uncharacterized protein n=1 Tax=Virgibacillus dokdonensis TaxID=302167 RepID=A0A3E0WNI3_9BACI|nr:hypothetical protein CAI16_14460 [Virgibacillus dokdonensis]